MLISSVISFRVYRYKYSFIRTIKPDSCWTQQISFFSFAEAVPPKFSSSDFVQLSMDRLPIFLKTVLAAVERPWWNPLEATSVAAE